MKISDLLRGLADAHVLQGLADDMDVRAEEKAARDRLAKAAAQPARAAQPAQAPEDNVDSPEGIFIPPLQQKIELMKKATGVNNVYDGDEDEVEERHSYPKMMMQLRRNAGLDASTLNDLADDEPLDS